MQFTVKAGERVNVSVILEAGVLAVTAPGADSIGVFTAKADLNVTLGDMWVKADKPSVKAGEVSIAVKNEGATMHGMAFAVTPVKAPGGMPHEAGPGHSTIIVCRPSCRNFSPAASR